MKNTGITYTSAERSPVILPEMAELLPPLSAEQLDALEADLIKNGCYAPIIINEDKKAFRDYLCRGGKPVSFRYEGQDYVITISKVSLYPQGYAAALTQGSLLDEPSVIVADIGGWTVDLMRLDNRIPNAATCRSLELGMIRCLDEISEQIRRGLDLSMTAAQIESVLRGDASYVNEDAKKIIYQEAERYTKRLLSAIAESGLDVRAMPAVFLGGGATLLKHHASAADGLCRPIILDDVCLNAKGYERLTERMSQKHEQ